MQQSKCVFDLYVVRHLNITDLRIFGFKFWSLDWPPMEHIWVYSDQISEKFRRRTKMYRYWNLIWESLGFVPFRSNQPHFGNNPDTPSNKNPCCVYVHRVVSSAVCLCSDVTSLPLFTQFDLWPTYVCTVQETSVQVSVI